MAGKNPVVYGIYSHRSQAEAGVDRLIAAGFRREDISVLMQDNTGTKDFAHVKKTKAPEGTTAGVVTGGAIGGAIGALIGVGLLAVPGLGPLIAAGPIIGALTGVGSGGIVGGIIGALIGMGIPEYEAKRYEGHIRKGGILASIHCDNAEWVAKAKKILKETGADDISSATEAKADFAVSDRPYPATDASHRGTTLGTLADTPAQTPTTPPPPPAVPVASTTTTVHEVPPASRIRVVPTSSTLAEDEDFRQHFNTHVRGGDYNLYAPAYRFGYEAAGDPRYRGRVFEDVEPELRTEYLRRYPGTSWDQFRNYVHYGWSKVPGNRMSASGAK